MADFKTHIATSSMLGVAYGGAAYGLFDLPPSTCLVAAGLCGVSGMLPDIDSGPGKPLREITTFMAAVVPVMLFDRFQRLGMSPEWIVLAGAGVYVLIRFGLANLLKRWTVHRGMFHSLPAAIIFGELAFLLASGDDTMLRWYKAGGVVLGYLSHLFLDEVYSVQWNGLPRLKKSFGTALKVFGHGWWPNLSAYAKLAVLTFLVIEEPGFMRQLHDGQMDRVIRQIAHDFPVDLPASISKTLGANIPGAQPAPQPGPGQPAGPEADRAGSPDPGWQDPPAYRTAQPPGRGAAEAGESVWR